MMPPEIKARVEKAKQSGKGGLALTQPFIIRNPQQPLSIDEVFCKRCGERIAGHIEDDRFQETRTVNGQPVIYRKLIFAQLPSYAQVIIQFNDGSRHVTQCCQNCVKELENEDLDAMYLADLVDFERAEAAGDAPVRWRLHGEKRAVGFKQEI